MKILLVKTSSMGDVIHTLPALTDAMQAIPGITVDWVIEPAFREIGTWHPGVRRIIPFELRRWRHQLFSIKTYKEILSFIKQLRAEQYDLIIDAQGLLKSTMISLIAKGPSHSYDKIGLREPYLRFFYNNTHHVPSRRDEHAIVRIRTLFAKTLGYPVPTDLSNFCIDHTKLPPSPIPLPEKYIVFLHSTTWDTKLYPESYWQKLLKHCETEKITALLPWGSEHEKKRAERIAGDSAFAIVLPRISIAEMTTILMNARVVIAVDTGFCHLSAALEKPTIVLFGATDAKILGIAGKNQQLLQSSFACSPCNSRTCAYVKTHHVDVFPPCFTELPPEKVWKIALAALMLTPTIDKIII